MESDLGIHRLHVIPAVDELEYDCGDRSINYIGELQGPPINPKSP